MPIHVLAFSGSTRNCHTVSGLAAITSSRSIATVSLAFVATLPLLSFCFTLQRIELRVPETVEEPLQLAEPLRTRAVEPLRPVPPLVHETRLLEDAEMLRDRRPRDVELRRDRAGRQLLVSHQLEDLPPPRLRDRS